MTAHSSTPSARDRLLAAAARLFYADGINATGIDAITAEAGVAKKSLYNNFSSKDDLVRAYVRDRHEEWLGLYRVRSAVASSPRECVLAVFDAYVDHASDKYGQVFRGCGLLNAAAELPSGAAGREAVRRHKEDVESILADHLGGLVPAETAASVAEHLSFLLEGAVSRAGLEGAPDRLLRARSLAVALLEDL